MEEETRAPPYGILAVMANPTEYFLLQAFLRRIAPRKNIQMPYQQEVEGALSFLWNQVLDGRRFKVILLDIDAPSGKVPESLGDISILDRNVHDEREPFNAIDFAPKCRNYSYPSSVNGTPGTDIYLLVEKGWEKDRKYDGLRERLHQLKEQGTISGIIEKPLKVEQFEGFVRQAYRLDEKKTVLIVDDDTDAIDLLETLLGDSYKVTRAGGVQEGIARLEEDRYSLVMTDVNMPDGKGWDIVEYVEENQGGTPILMMSTNWGQEEKERARTHRCIVDTLNKPFETRRVEDLVRRVANEER